SIASRSPNPNSNPTRSDAATVRVDLEQSRRHGWEVVAPKLKTEFRELARLGRVAHDAEQLGVLTVLGDGPTANTGEIVRHHQQRLRGVREDDGEYELVRDRGVRHQLEMAGVSRGLVGQREATARDLRVRGVAETARRTHATRVCTRRAR